MPFGQAVNVTGKLTARAGLPDQANNFADSPMQFPARRK